MNGALYVQCTLDAHEIVMDVPHFGVHVEDVLTEGQQDDHPDDDGHGIVCLGKGPHEATLRFSPGLTAACGQLQ